MKLVQSILTKNPCYTAGRKITVKGRLYFYLFGYRIRKGCGKTYL